MWRQYKVPADWHDAVLVPLAKQGNLSFCDNCWGIALLEAVGKVVETVLIEAEETHRKCAP